MPMLDAYLPVGVLEPEAQSQLLKTVTDLLLKYEGVDPANEKAQEIAWMFVHHYEMYVGGRPANLPYYRFICQVPEGQYNDKRRAAVTREITEAVATAEGGRWPNPKARVWVFTYEVPDGTWGGLGQIFRLPDIAAYVEGEPSRQLAQRRLELRRQSAAREIVAAAALNPISA